MDQSKLTITEHLTELRARMIIAVAGVFVTTGLAAVFSPELLDYSIQPLLRVLEDKARVETLVVHADEARASSLAALVAENPRTRVGAPLVGFDSLRPLAQAAVAKKNPIDLVLVSSEALGGAGVLAADVLEGIEPPPYVLYLVPSKDDPLVEDLVLDGANVILEPPRTIALSRHVRRAAGAAGKSAAVDKLVVLSPLDPFFAYLKIALVIGLFAACPIWLYQGWRFVAPGLYGHEKRFVLPVIGSGSILFVSGGLFAYFAMFPLMFDVLVNQMMPASVASSFTIDKYLSLLMQMTVAFGVVFELPLALAIAAFLGVVHVSTLRRFRRYWVVTAFVLGAILTPADPISQVMMAVPLVLFYEVGVFAAALIDRHRVKKSEQLELAMSDVSTPPPTQP